MFPKVPHFIWVIVPCNAVPVNDAKISQKFSFVEILELSDFHSFMHIGAKMSNFACTINSIVITYTNIDILPGEFVRHKSIRILEYWVTRVGSVIS